MTEHDTFASLEDLPTSYQGPVMDRETWLSTIVMTPNRTKVPNDDRPDLTEHTPPQLSLSCAKIEEEHVCHHNPNADGSEEAASLPMLSSRGNHSVLRNLFATKPTLSSQATSSSNVSQRHNKRNGQEHNSISPKSKNAALSSLAVLPATTNVLSLRRVNSNSTSTTSNQTARSAAAACTVSVSPSSSIRRSERSHSNETQKPSFKEEGDVFNDDPVRISLSPARPFHHPNATQATETDSMPSVCFMSPILPQRLHNDGEEVGSTSSPRRRARYAPEDLTDDSPSIVILSMMEREGREGYIMPKFHGEEEEVPRHEEESEETELLSSSHANAEPNDPSSLNGTDAAEGDITKNVVAADPHESVDAVLFSPPMGEHDTDVSLNGEEDDQTVVVGADVTPAAADTTIEFVDLSRELEEAAVVVVASQPSNADTVSNNSSPALVLAPHPTNRLTQQQSDTPPSMPKEENRLSNSEKGSASAVASTAAPPSIVPPHSATIEKSKSSSCCVVM